MGAEPDPEESFGPYLVYERLGVGGMATVHRARERGIEGFERIVALKRLLPHLAEDATFIKAFVREAKLASALNHVNIVQIYELGRVGTEYFISMEHIDGRDIRRVLRHARKVTGPPPPNVTVGLLLQLCDALDYAHNKIDAHGVPMGLVHRDVSPSNVLVTTGGNVKVIDFGIAKAQSSQLRTQTGRVKGKLAYMAPEAIAGGRELDARSDLFAVGVIAHELLTARPLFASKNEYQTLLKVQRGDIMPPSTFNQNVQPELDAIVLRALARDPDDRFSSAAELRDELLAMRHRYRLQTGVRDVSMWLDWAFALDLPTEALASGGVASDAPIADLAWDGGEGSGSPIVLDDVPDVSQRVAMPAQLLRESQPRLFDEDPGMDVQEDDDDVPTPVPQPPRRASTPNITARTATGSRASSELLDALHAANDAAATLESMPPAQAFGVDTQPTGKSLAKDSAEMDRVSTGQIARPSMSDLDDQTSVVVQRAPAPTFDPGLEVSDEHVTDENGRDVDPTTGKSKHRAPVGAHDDRDGVIEPPRPTRATPVPSRATPVPSRATPTPSRTAIGVARDTPVPSLKTASMIPKTPPARPTPDLSRATPTPDESQEMANRRTGDIPRDAPRTRTKITGPEQTIDDDAPVVRVAATKPIGMRRAPHASSLSTPVSEGSVATSAAGSRPSEPTSLDEVPAVQPATAESAPVDPKKPRTKLGHKPARASTTPVEDDPSVAMVRSERKARQPNPGASIGMSIIEREATPNRTWLVLALIALVGGGAAATLYLTRTPKAAPLEAKDTKPPVGTTGTVALELEPMDAEVSIDGALVHTGSPWQTDLSAGPHSVEIHKDGYKAWLTSVKVIGGERQTLRVALAPVGGPSAGSGSVSKQPAMKAPAQTPTRTPPPPSESHGEMITTKTDTVAEADVPTPPIAPTAAATSIPMATTLSAGTTPPTATTPPAITTAPGSPTAVEAKPAAPTVATNPLPAPPPPATTKPAAPKTPIVATSGAPATVAPSAVNKLSGELPELVSKNDVATIVAAKMCIDWQGSVTSVDLISKLEPRMALEMKNTLAAWKYAPYQAPGARVPSAACFAVSFRTK